LIAPIAMEKELRFAIREGGRTVGAGVVTEIEFRFSLGLGFLRLLQFHPGILAWADEVVTEVRKVVFPSREKIRQQ
jgi:hypothetical protein